MKKRDGFGGVSRLVRWAWTSSAVCLLLANCGKVDEQSSNQTGGGGNGGSESGGTAGTTAIGGYANYGGHTGSCLGNPCQPGCFVNACDCPTYTGPGCGNDDNAGAGGAAGESSLGGTGGTTPIAGYANFGGHTGACISLDYCQPGCGYDPCTAPQCANNRPADCPPLPGGAAGAGGEAAGGAAQSAPEQAPPPPPALVACYSNANNAACLPADNALRDWLTLGPDCYVRGAAPSQGLQMCCYSTECGASP